MSQTQTVVLEQTVEPQSITLKFNDSSSNANPISTVDPQTQNPVNDPNPKTDQENQSITVNNDDHESNHESNHAIQIPNVDSQTQTAVNEFIQRHGSPDEEERTAAMNAIISFVEGQEIGTLLIIAQFASDVNNAELLGVVCDGVANMIKDKKVEEVREIFNITNDFTPEEEQAVRDEHPWAYED